MEWGSVSPHQVSISRAGVKSPSKESTGAKNPRDDCPGELTVCSPKEVEMVVWCQSPNSCPSYLPLLVPRASPAGCPHRPGGHLDRSRELLLWTNFSTYPGPLRLSKVLFFSTQR